MIYGYIKEVGNKGIWIKSLKNRTGLTTQVDKAIKSMEKMGIIKSVKSIKHPTQKLYMLAELIASEELTGGAWYSDNEIDIEFIEFLSDQVYSYIHSQSFQETELSLQTCTRLDIYNWIKSKKLSNTILTIDNIQELLEKLIFDDKIYCVDDGYRAVKKGKSEFKSLLGLPCLDCVEYKYCWESGPISPVSCKYFPDWF
jgi:DNA-directed RNA polymerase III subunit RPC6